MKYYHAVCLIAALLAGSTVFAQSDTPRTDSWSTDGDVHALLEDGNDLFIGGDFDYVGPSTGSVVLADKSTGTLNATLPRIDGNVNVVIPDGAGGFYLGGTISGVGGTVVQGLAHVTSSLALNTAFTPAVSGAVNDMALSGGVLYFGGDFTSVAGQPRQYLAAVDTSTGALMAWAPSAGSPVYSMAESGGTIYIGGSFTTVNGTSRGRLAALDSSGNLTAWDPNATSGTVIDMQVTGSTLTVCGSFGNFGGTSGNPTVAQQKVAQINLAGTGAVVQGMFDNYYPTGGTPTELHVDGNTLYATGTFDEIQYHNDSIAVFAGGGDAPRGGFEEASHEYAGAEPDGSGGWYVFGRFTSIGTTPVSYIARLQSNGALDTTFAPSTISDPVDAVHYDGSTLYVAFRGGGNGTIHALNPSTGVRITTFSASYSSNGIHEMAADATHLFLGGAFVNVNSTSQTGFAGIDKSTGALNPAFPGVSGGQVDDLIVDSGNVFIGGTFTSVGGTTRNYLAAVDASSGGLNSWAPSPNYFVHALELSATHLYAGGRFTTVSGSGRMGIAEFNKSTLALTGTAYDVEGAIFELAMSGTSLHVAGEFSTVEGESRENLAAFDVSTGDVAYWAPRVNTTTANLDDIRFGVSSGQLAMVGHVNTIRTPRLLACAFDLVNEEATGWNPTVEGYFVSAIATDGSNVFLGGEFQRVGNIDNSGSANGLARRNFVAVNQTDGGPGSLDVSTSDRVHDLLSLGSEILVAGVFSSVGGRAQSNLAKFDRSTLTVTTWDPMHAGVVQSLLLDGNTLYVGGNRPAAYDTTSAAPTGWSPGVNGSVQSMAQDGNEIYLGGNFTALDNYNTPNNVVFNTTTGYVDTSFENTSWNVICSVPDGAGGWYIGTDHGLRRLLSTGQLDANFDLYTDDYVSDIVLYNGVLYVSGGFSTIDGVARNGLASVDAANGNVTGWDPDPDDRVLALHEAGGTLYVGGEFTTISGTSQNYAVAYNTTTGTITSWDPAPDNYVYDLASDGSSIFMVGRFANVGGTARGRIADVDPATGAVGTLDTPANQYTFTCTVIGTRLFVTGNFSQVDGLPRTELVAIDLTTESVNAWAPDPGNTVTSLVEIGGTLYVGGSFLQIAGASRSRLAAFDASTLTIQSFDGKLDNSVSTLSSSGTLLFAGGSFDRAGGLTRANLGVVDATTGLAGTWAPAADDQVHSLAIDGSDLYVGGRFNMVDGQTRNGAASFDLNTGNLAAWNPDVNGFVQDIAIDSTWVYLGGSFDLVDGQSYANLAKVDRSSGSSQAWAIGTDGIVYDLDLDSGLVAFGGYFDMVGTPTGGIVELDSSTASPSGGFARVAGRVETVIADGTGGWFVGGEFVAPGATPLANLIHILPNGTIDQNFTPNPNDLVQALHLIGTTLYVGGQFTQIGGATRAYLAAIDADSTSGTYGDATAWAPQASDWVYAFADDGTNLYVGGKFVSINSNARPYLAAFELSTGTLTTWSGGADNTVVALEVDSSTVFVGGRFSSIGGQTRNHIAAIDANPASGTFGQATTWDPNAENGRVTSLALSGNTVYLAGFFDTVGGQPRACLAAVNAITGAVETWSYDVSNGVFAIAVQGTSVAAGGTITIAEIRPQSGLGSASASTGQLSNWQPQVTRNPHGFVYAVEMVGTAVYAGGNFTAITGVSVSNFAVFDDSPRIVTSSPLRDGYESASYNSVFLLAAGGTPAYTWSISGQPAWLSINAATGELTGNVPAGTAGQNFTFDITVEDTQMLTDSRSFTLNIAALTPISITSSSPLPDAYEGAPYSRTLAASGGATPYQWSIQNAPAWLTINSTTGEVSGNVPSGIAPTTVNFDVTVDDQASQQDVQPFSFDVLPVTSLTITTSANLGSSYETVPLSGLTLQGSGGVPAYQWSLTGAPGWLSIDPVTGDLDGTPPAGTAPATINFNAVLTDSVANSTNKAMSLDIIAIPQPGISSASPLPAASEGTSYSQTLTAAGGTPGYTWSASVIPNWLSLNAATGELTGTPPSNSHGNWEIEVTVTDSFTPPQSSTGVLVLPVQCTPCGPVLVDSWIPRSNLNSGVGAPSHRRDATAVWTGTHMIVWGGSASDSDKGGMYNPSTDTWENRPDLNNATGAPSYRYAHSAIWTGEKMIVWGGIHGGTYRNSGGIYNPATDTWEYAPNLSSTAAGAPPARAYHCAVWTGQYMIIWGGRTNTSWYDDGHIYDPDTDTWLSAPNLNAHVNAPGARAGAEVTWTGRRMVVWGGYLAGGSAATDGGVYNPRTDTWESAPNLNSATGAPSIRVGSGSCWDGERWITWAGAWVNPMNDGGAYNAGSDQWENLPSLNNGTNAPSARTDPNVHWACSGMIAWGGRTLNQTGHQGGLYDPTSDAWLSAPNLNGGTGAHDGVEGAASVWTGCELIVWGGEGYNNQQRNTGGVYQPWGQSASPIYDVSITAVDAAAAESSGSPQTGTFEVSVASQLSTPITVAFQLGGTANTSQGVDYILSGFNLIHSGPGGTFVIPANTSSVLIELTPTDDSSVEGIETATMTLQSGAGYTVGSPSSADILILDNDGGTPVVSVMATGNANEDGSADGGFRIVANPVPSGTLVIDFELSGTAEFQDDYTVTGALVTPAPSAPWSGVVQVDSRGFADVVISAVSDNSTESTESIILTLQAGSGYILGSPNTDSLDVIDGGPSSGGGGGGDEDESCSTGHGQSPWVAVLLLAVLAVVTCRQYIRKQV